MYVSEEAVAIWRLSAEPNGGTTKTLVDRPVTQGGHFQPDAEGLAIYYKSDGTGYLIASSQGDNSYTIYTREGTNAFVGKFQIIDGTVDATDHTDGIDVTNFPLGTTCDQGVFVAQDGKNFDNGIRKNQNFKLVRWDAIANMLGLSIDMTWDPRNVGK